MKPVDQDRFGHGEGNCYAAAIASILELDLEELRAFERLYLGYWSGAIHGHHDFEKRGAYLRELRRLGVTAVTLSCATGDRIVPKGYSIADGPSPRGIDHSCVALDGELVHDPHPSRGGLVEVKFYEVLVPVLGSSDG